jgi:DNA-binding NarL/FixJ family response regulator
VLLARGLYNAKIASELGVAVGVIRSNVRSALGKLGAHSRAQAVANARRAGIVNG